MAGVRKKVYSFTVGGVTLGVKLPENYYNNIDTICGFTEASDTNIPRAVLGVSDALRAGLLVQIGILYLKGTRLTRSKILCSVANLQTAVTALRGKNYRSLEIRSAYFTQQRRLG